MSSGASLETPRDPNTCLQYVIITYEFMPHSIRVDGIRYLHDKSNISRNCIKQLFRISASDDIVVNVADKNLGLCVNDISWYIQEYSRHIALNYLYMHLYLVLVKTLKSQ